jgi:lactate dehydrogenase-like 2-hydroxyacid dehydrogenase
MGQLPKAGIKLIDLRSAGYDNVDLEAAANNKIKVMRVPAYTSSNCRTCHGTNLDTRQENT